MAQTIKLRRSSVSGQKPTNANLQLGELAVNTTDGKVFLAKSGSLGPTIEEIVTTNTINTGSITLIGGVTVSGDISGSNIKGNTLTISNDASIRGSLMNGVYNETLGDSSHAEGVFTKAIGGYSHTEGIFTQAIGDYSHAEGLGTIASGSSQHVQGMYNLPLPDVGAFIVGNGMSETLRSNLLFASGSIVQITGSLTVTQGITGSLQGTASFAMTSSFLGNSTNGFIQGGNSFGSAAIIGTNDNQNLILETSGTTRIFVSSSGYIGIGTTTPNSTLDVNGNTTLSGSLMVSQSLIQYSSVTSVPSGSVTDVMSFNTGSYTATFFDFVITSGSNSRAGTIFTTWNGNNIEYAETSTNDIGDTSSVQLSTSISNGLVKLRATSIMGSWKIKTLARII